MKRHLCQFRIGLALAVCWTAPVLSSPAAEPELTAKDLPRLPAVSPRDAPKTFRVKKGFHAELVASEPLIASPVALSFDERGRMYVAEMIDYSERREETPHLGRIRLLEDTRGDGVFDRSSVYADNLPWPTAVFCSNGGVFVGATPDILYLKDTKGSGRADFRETVFTGFAEGMDRVNVQELLNSFVWGLDNRIHGATSGDGGMIRSLRHPGAKPVDLHGRDFVIEPRSMSMTSEAGGGQHGLSFDDYGRRFTCNNSDHIRLFLYDDRYAARNPFFVMPPPLQSIAVDGAAAEVYRISPEEPWRVIRTRWRVAGLVAGPIEGGGRSAGYFTGATGALIYRGDAFPKEYQGNVFLGDAGGNLVHRKILLPDGVGLKAQRAADEQTVEFAASTDTWFRPVQFANAPDGALYVIDMYRETIEHPWSLPQNIKKFLDLNSGNDRGRIYRIVPDGFKQPKPPRLDLASTKALVATIENPNGWHRDTASRLLYERQDASAVPGLVELARTSKSPLGRIHALHALDGLGSLTESTLLRALEDENLWVRVHAVELSEKFSQIPASAGPLFKKLSRMTGDPSDLVRCQLAFTLGEFPQPERIPALAEIARTGAESSWTLAAVLSSLSNGAGEVFALRAADADFGASKGGGEFLRQLSGLVGARNDPKEVNQVVKYIAGLAEQGLSFSLARSLDEGLKRAGASVEQADTGGELKGVFARAELFATKIGAPEETRLEGIRLLGLTTYAVSGPTLLSLIQPSEPASIQVAAVSTLGRFRGTQASSELTRRWGDFPPRIKSEALSVLLAQPTRAAILLQAIEAGTVRPAELSTAQTKFLRTHRDAKVRNLALKGLGASAPNQRQTVIDEYHPALELAGDAVKGREIYLRRCSSCHRLGGAGFALGPDLVTVKNSGKEKLLVNILDPSREVAPPYIAFQIDTRDGESLIGIIADETTASITVRQPYGKEDVIPLPQVKSMRSQGQSLMPEGLEQGLTRQDFANLLEYISTAQADK
jgi:putative membrane-bound dehydrogenase-like protein